MTEASYLTYPEDYSTDELNTIPNRAGNRTRRLGINYENDFRKASIVNSVDDTVKEFVWQSVDNRAEDNFLVLQVGQIIHFYGLEAVPVSDSKKAFTINLADYQTEGASILSIRQNKCEFASGKGFLFVVHPHVEPFLVEYDKATDSISVTRIVVQMRDFDGLDDGLANDQEPTTLSKEHWYNLLNQGWLMPNPIVPPGGVTPPSQPVYINPSTGNSEPYRRYNDSNERIP